MGELGKVTAFFEVKRHLPFCTETTVTLMKFFRKNKEPTVSEVGIFVTR